jgi:hypothetical protein
MNKADSIYQGIASCIQLRIDKAVDETHSSERSQILIRDKVKFFGRFIGEEIRSGILILVVSPTSHNFL